MIPAPVSYEGAIKKKVDEFNALPHDKKNGDYWKKTDNNELSDVKKHIKDYYKIVQDYICPYCQQKIIVDHNAIWDAEHIIPKDTRPEFMFEPENLCVSCKDCNGEKLNKNVLKNPNNIKFPRNNDAYLICHPHFDEYDKHIRIINNPHFFIPRTDKGRETIEVCGLLRFMYFISEYGDAPLDIIQQVDMLNKELQNATGAGEQTVILAFMMNLCDQGIRMAQKARFAHLSKPSVKESTSQLS